MGFKAIIIMKTFKIMNLLLCLILFISCNKKLDHQDLSYFTFDELEYYHKDIAENDLLAEYKKSKTANYNDDFLKIVEQEYPTKLDDQKFAEILSKCNYIKKSVPKSKLKEFNKIFSEKEDCEELTANGCSPIYRDIFIFKNKGKVTGIVKVCFQCRFIYIIGTKKNWDYFGECGDYEKLQSLLKTI